MSVFHNASQPTRYSILAHLSFAAIMLYMVISCQKASPIPVACPLVRAGQPQAIIVIPNNPSEEVQAAAKLLSQSIAKATGASLKVVDEGLAGTDAKIHVGPTRLALQSTPDLARLNEDSFIIKPVDASNVIIIGASDWGTEFGVTEFLERQVGILWLLPGNSGTYIPRRSDISGPVTTIQQSPVSTSRFIGGIHGQEQINWARRNRMHSRTKFGHNMLNIFPRQVYAKTNPNFLSATPAGGDDVRTGWQPCFSQLGTVPVAVRNINKYFDKNPDVRSFSLGVNDGGGFCEIDMTPGVKNYLGEDSASEAYYAWCNAVVTEVLKSHPDKWFGLLAYRNVAEPPQGFKLHQRIVPYITSDRMEWVSVARVAQGRALTERWQAAATNIAWYDYIYGWPYALPRIYFHRMADNYRYAAQHGVREHYAEAYPNWGEGPKLWLALKLQWNPQQDVDSLLNTWYVACVGEEAAPDLAAYYRLWEDYWTKAVPNSHWYKNSTRTYLDFKDPGYMDVLTPATLNNAKQLLQSALAKTKTADQRARAQILMRSFEYYEATAKSYLATKSQGGEPRTEAEALAKVNEANSALEFNAKRRRLAQDILNDPQLGLAKKEKSYDTLEDMNWVPNALLELGPWVKKSPKVHSSLQNLLKSPNMDIADGARSVLRIGSGASPNLLDNPSFEEAGRGNTAQSWTWWKRDEIFLERTNRFARSGQWSVLASGIGRGGPVQSVTATPGEYIGTCYVYVPAGYDQKGEVTLSLTLRGATGKIRPAASPQSLVPNQWVRLSTKLELPADVGIQASAAKLSLVVTAKDFTPGQQVFIDDCQLYKVK